MTEEEVETLLAGHEDANGCINYEGKQLSLIIMHIDLSWEHLRFYEPSICL